VLPPSLDLKSNPNKKLVCSVFHIVFKLFFGPEEGGENIPPKHLLNYNGLHSVTTQKIELFITISVRPSNGRDSKKERNMLRNKMCVGVNRVEVAQIKSQ
jgi:hypothetical protein